jgi:hypothetical protein
VAPPPAWPLVFPAQTWVLHPPPIPPPFTIPQSRTPPCSVHARPRIGVGSRPRIGIWSLTDPFVLDFNLLSSLSRCPAQTAIPGSPLGSGDRSHRRTTQPTSHPRRFRNTRPRTHLTPTSINNTRRANTPITCSLRRPRRSTTSRASKMPPDRRRPRRPRRLPGLASERRRRGRCSSSPLRSATSNSP